MTIIDMVNDYLLDQRERERVGGPYLTPCEYLSQLLADWARDWKTMLEEADSDLTEREREDPHYRAPREYVSATLAAYGRVLETEIEAADSDLAERVDLSGGRVAYRLLPGVRQLPRRSRDG